MAERIELRSLLPPANKQGGETSERETLEKIMEKRRRRKLEELDRADVDHEIAKTDYETRQYEKDRAPAPSETAGQEQLVVDLEAEEPGGAVKKVAKGEPIIIARSQPKPPVELATKKGGWILGADGTPIMDQDGEWTFNQAVQVMLAKKEKTSEGKGDIISVLTFLQNQGLLGAGATKGGSFESKFMDELAKKSVDSLIHPPVAPPQGGGGSDMLGILSKFGVNDLDGLIKFARAVGGDEKSERSTLPVKGGGEIDISDYIVLDKHKGEERRKDEMHEATVGLVKTLKQHAGTAAKALDRAMSEKEESHPQSQQPQSQPQAPQEPAVNLTCGVPGCGAVTVMTKRALTAAGNKFICASCGQENIVGA
jgi:predicted RNA-binding Zn-ribbon protein involved in translation (DUF1610 family)